MGEQANKDNKEVKFQTGGEKIASLIADSLIEVNRRFRICRGLLSPEQELELSQNAQVLIQINGLLDLINSQKELITNGRAAISYKSTKDHKSLMISLEALRYFEKVFIKSIKTRSREDDFMVVINRNNEMPDRNELTDNFYDMMEDLEILFEDISKVLLRNGLLTPVTQTSERRSKLSGY